LAWYALDQVLDLLPELPALFGEEYL